MTRHKMRPLAGGLLCIALSGLSPSGAFAQFNEPPPPAAYALRGVTLVAPDGRRTEGVTLVVRGAMIEAIGPSVEVPPDARILEGDSLYVYPGLIDAAGKAAFEFPEEEVNRQEIPSWNPPRSVQGFTPHRSVVEVLTAVGADLASQRKKGVVAAAVHPEGPLMPGRGALLLFRKLAATPAELVVRPALGTVFSFERPRGVYPSTHFGIVAFMRQAFEDARRHALILREYERDPKGMPVPEWDPDLDILTQAAEGTIPVLFKADGTEDIRQVVSLSEEYGFRPILVGGSEAWRVASILRERGVPVLVSLDFPKPERWDPKKETKEQEADTAQAPVEPLDPAAQREKDRLENVYANAGRLAKAGVTIALTSGGGKADLIDGARKAIEYGLSEEQALAALTATPAELVGAPQLSRVEPGLPATFIATDGPLFDEETKILYTFVEGELEEGATAPGAEAGEAALADVTGTWEVELDAEGQSLGGKMTLEQDEEGTFSGTLELPEVGTVRIRDGLVSGNSMNFTLVVSFGGETMEMDASGTIEGDEATGSGSGPMGSFRWTATRVGTPNWRAF